MATNTTNFNLSKPDYTDTADIAVINGNMDKVDVSLNGLADAIAIVAKNNTHAAITAGQYVYVHGHSSLAEGLYTAKSNIAANATLSTSNLQADGSGGLNALNSNTVKITDRVAIDRTLSSSCADCDEITDVGFYRVIASTQNRPSDVSYGILFYMRSNDYNAQIIIATNGSMYCRGKGSGSTWNAWKTVSVS